MGQETIHPTNHAIERFEERVLPLIPEDSRSRLNDKRKIKQQLYNLARRANISAEESQMIHIQTFLTTGGHPLIPLTLVVDSVKKTLVTLYISPGWVLNESNGRFVWRWSA